VISWNINFLMCHHESSEASGNLTHTITIEAIWFIGRLMAMQHSPAYHCKAHLSFILFIVYSNRV